MMELANDLFVLKRVLAYILCRILASLGRNVCLIKPTSVFGRDNEQRKVLQHSTKSPQATTRGARQSILASPKDKASKTL